MLFVSGSVHCAELRHHTTCSDLPLASEGFAVSWIKAQRYFTIFHGLRVIVQLAVCSRSVNQNSYVPPHFRYLVAEESCWMKLGDGKDRNFFGLGHLGQGKIRELTSFPKDRKQTTNQKNLLQ